MSKCLFPKCNKKQRARGLCSNHWQYCRRLIVKGKTTFEELEKKGKCLPKSKTKNSDFYDWLELEE